MATFGSGNGTLTAITFPRSDTRIAGSYSAPADIATANAAIYSYGNTTINTALNGNELTLPDGRGTIRLRPGDSVMWDSTGWPIVVSYHAALNGGWTVPFT